MALSLPPVRQTPPVPPPLPRGFLLQKSKAAAFTAWAPDKHPLLEIHGLVRPREALAEAQAKTPP